METRHAPHQLRPSDRSPGRRAAELRPRGIRIMLPFVYLAMSVLGVAGLVVAPSGLWVRGQLVRMAARVGSLPFVGAPPIPSSTWWIAGGGALLLAGGLLGLAHGGRLERRRERLIEMADARREAGTFMVFEQAA